MSTSRHDAGVLGLTWRGPDVTQDHTGGTIPEEEKKKEATASSLHSCCVLPVALDSPVLGDKVPDVCWGSTSCLPSGASLVAGAEETEGLGAGLGIAFAVWELDGVSPGVT